MVLLTLFGSDALGGAKTTKKAKFLDEVQKTNGQGNALQYD
jgi:hypothetical protein